MHTKSPPHNCCHPKIIKFVFFIVIFIKPTFECLGSSNASLLHPKIPYLHLTQNQDHPVAHPPKNLTNFHHLPSFVGPQLYHSPHHPLHNLPDLLCVGVLHQTLVQSVSQLLGPPDRTISFAYVCNFWRLSMSHVWNHQFQHYNVTLCVFHNATRYINSLLTCIHVNTTCYPCSNSVISRALWLPQVWYYGA